MAQAALRSRVDDLDASFERRARANRRSFGPEVEELLKCKEKFTPEEGWPCRGIFVLHPGIQLSLTLSESREGSE